MEEREQKKSTRRSANVDIGLRLLSDAEADFEISTANIVILYCI